MTEYRIVPCRLSHIREIVRTMRAEDRAEFHMAGLDPKHRLYELHAMTAEPKAAVVDGEVAAVWGDAAAFLAPEGLMWMVTAPAVERVPLAFFREAKKEIAGVLEHRRSLRSCIGGPYGRAIRFFTMLGFDVQPPIVVDGNEYRAMRLARHG
jgi:hypothetical protein